MIEARLLSKVFHDRKRGAIRGADQVSFRVEPGQIYGLLGANGAGKTTTLRMATGLLRPDGGAVWVDGIEVWADPVAAKRRIGVLPEDLNLFERLSGIELLTYYGLLRRMDMPVITSRARELLDVLNLADSADTMVVDYSHGMRKKIALAAALLHSPRVLFLDEPFEAIDPVSARAIRGVLERLTQTGATVVFSSHVMELVESLCDRVAIVNAGRVVASGSLDEVRQGQPLEDVFVRLVGAVEAPAGTLEWLGSSSD
jgi:ABC-2 type transport system ATP-binding protein